MARQRRLPAAGATRASHAQFTPELSRRARGVEVWAALRSLGRAGLAELVERNCRQAARFAEGLRAAGYEILNEVVLNQVLVSFGDADDAPARVIAAHPGRRHLLVRRHRLAGADAPCASASPPGRTTDEDVERSLAAMMRLARSA